MKIAASICFVLLLFLLIFSLLFNFCSTNATENEGKLPQSISPQNIVSNSVDRVKRESEAKHAIKSFGITILALLAGTVVLGIDYSITTIFTPLMIITLTKNIDVKAIIDTCNYRRRQHLANQNGQQNWAKALLCMPTEDEAHIHKRRFFLDVMKVAFKHVKPKTSLATFSNWDRIGKYLKCRKKHNEIAEKYFQLIQKEYEKYLKLTEYMGESKNDWNAPKMTRTLLLFLANYGLIDPNEPEKLPKFINADDVHKEMATGMKEAVKELYSTNPEFLDEEIRIEKEKYPNRAAQIDAEIRAYKEEVDSRMEDAERIVMQDYQKNSLKFKINEKLKAVSRTMRKFVGWPTDEEDLKKQKMANNAEKEYQDYLKEIKNKNENELTITEKIDKYGLMNYEIVSQELLAQLTRDLAYPHGTLIRAMSEKQWKSKWESLSAAAQHLGNRSELDLDNGRMENVELNLKAEKAIGNEMMENMEEAKERHIQHSIYLDPATLANYPKLFRQLLRKVFEEEIQKLTKPELLSDVVIEDDINLRKVYIELAKMPLQIKKLYIQYGLFRTVVALLKEMLKKEDHKVQKYYLMFLYERKPVKDLFNKFRIETSKNLAIELRKRIYEEMLKKNDQLKIHHAEFLEKFKLANKIRNFWVKLPPRQAFEKSEEEIIKVCKGGSAIFQWAFGHPRKYQNAEECAVKEAKPLMELYEHFLLLSNQFRIKRQENPKIGEKLNTTENEQIYNEKDEEVGKFIEENGAVKNVPFLDQLDDTMRVSRLLNSIIEDQKREFRELTEENIQFGRKDNAKIGQNEKPKFEQNLNDNLIDDKKLGEGNVRRNKRFVVSTVLINIMRTSGWMQLFKHFNVIEIIRDCIVRSINFQQWTCEYLLCIYYNKEQNNQFNNLFISKINLQQKNKIKYRIG